MFSKKFDDISGSAIREILKVTQNPKVISFAGGTPAPETFPYTEVQNISNEVLQNNPTEILQYATTEGYKPLVGEIIGQLKKENIKAEENEIQMLAGSQQGIDFVANILLDKDDVVLVEAPTFLGALQIFKLHGAKIVSVETDENGIIIDDLITKIKKYNPKFLYTIPTFQNPSGKTLEKSRREKIAQLASEYNFFVLEDDPYHLLRYDGEAIPEIKTYDTTGNVIHLISFSKTIAPGLRLGACVARADVLRKITICKQLSDLHCSNLSQAIAYEFFAKGFFNKHIQKICGDYKIKKDAMIKSIEKYFPNDVISTKPHGGFFIWCQLPKEIDGEDLFKKAIEKDVAVVPGTFFYPDNSHKNTFRLSFCANSPERNDIGIEKLGEIIKSY